MLVWSVTGSLLVAAQLALIASAQAGALDPIIVLVLHP